MRLSSSRAGIVVWACPAGHLCALRAGLGRGTRKAGERRGMPCSLSLSWCPRPSTPARTPYIPVPLLTQCHPFVHPIVRRVRQVVPGKAPGGWARQCQQALLIASEVLPASQPLLHASRLHTASTPGPAPSCQHTTAARAASEPAAAVTELHSSPTFTSTLSSREVKPSARRSILPTAGSAAREDGAGSNLSSRVRP